MRRRAVGVGLVVGAIVVAGAALVLGSVGRGSSSADAGAYRGSEPPDGIAMSAFTLRNYDGRLVNSSDLSGRVTVLTFLDSQCTESCPVIAWTVARALDTLRPDERRDITALAISTDPAEDAPRTVRSFLERNRAVGRLLYVGGGQPESELRPVWNAFEVLSSLESGQDTLHSAPVRIYDRSGTWVASLHAGADLSEANLAHDVRVALES